MKRKLLSLLVLLTVAVTGAKADFGWYSASMSIGGMTTDFTKWSTDGNNPTDLGYLTSMTITSIAFNVWSDSNDRGGANMYFRIWDGGSSQVGTNQDLWLGAATRISGDHDFSISWTGSVDLASAVDLTLVPGKTYYIDMWAKTYGAAGDEWYSANNSNYHAKFTYLYNTIAFASGNDNTGWTLSTTTAKKDNEITVSYSGVHKVKSVKYNNADATGSGNTYTFKMPAENVEVTTELWYKLDEDATDNQTNYGTKVNVFLNRTLNTLPEGGGWNTFCAPFAIADPATVFGTGVKVKAFTGSTLNNGVLTLNFADASTIAAGTPYLIQLPGTTTVDLSADGKEFSGITPAWTSVPVTGTGGYATFTPLLEKTLLTAGQDKLFVIGGNKLTFPTGEAYMKAFRAYFTLPSNNARSFVMDFGDGETTGIQMIENAPRVNENTNTFDLQGRKVADPTQKGIYIQNGKKVIIK
jgi:hypothetical protein